MLNKLLLNTTRLRNLLRILDMCTIILFWCAFFRFRLGFWDQNILYSNRFALILISLMLASYILEASECDPRKTLSQLVTRYIYSCLLATLFISAVFYFSALAWTNGGHNLLGRGIVVPAFIGTALVGGTARYILFNYMLRRQKLRNWLVIGSHEKSIVNQFWDALCLHVPGENVHYWDPVSGCHEVRVNKKIDILQSSTLKDLLENEWAGIILLDDLAIEDKQIELLMHARLAGITIKTVAEFYEEVWHKVPVMHLNNRWFAITGGFGLLHEPVHRRVKRLCDLGLAGLLLVLTFPLILLIAMWIKVVGGRGAIIYKQVRTGQNGTSFTILKLRTMYANSELNGAQWASTNDKRIILFGNILRKFRIDELPQLWNIIIGDMSFIGPRPERPEIIVGLENKIPFYSLRHLIKPGLTGWAQVSYPYGASIDDAREKLEYDLYYVKHQTIWLDLTIILRTVRVILRGFGGR